MKKITIEITSADGLDILGPGRSIAEELDKLALLLSQIAYRDDENAVRNRLAWYKAEDPMNKLEIKIS